MYREPKLPHVLCGLSFCEACHFVRPIPVSTYHCLGMYKLCISEYREEREREDY